MRKSTVAPHKRLRAARSLRQGNSIAATHRETGIGEATLQRWLKHDPDFISLVHGKGSIQVGPVRIVADHDATTLEDVPDESLAWIDPATATVLGSVAVTDATHLRVVFVSDPVRTTAELQAGRLPYDPNARTTMLKATALPALADTDDVQFLCRLAANDDPEDAFRAFASVWKFRAGESGDVRTLGEHLWAGQERLLRILCREPHIYVAKARKLGFTSLAVAYAGYASRFRDPGNTRVHEFSYRERAALQLLSDTRYGLDNLPDFLRLPVKRETLKLVAYDAGGGFEHIIEAFPTSDSTAVELVSTHALIDELADIPRNEQVFASLYPTFAAPGCTSVLLTTGKGPQDWSATYYRKCKDGDGLHVPVFVPATARPDRDEGWLERTRRNMTQAAFRTEFALSEEDVFAGHSGFFFNAEDVETAARYAVGKQSWTAMRRVPTRGRAHRFDNLPTRYIIGWDIGGDRPGADASVGICLDVTRPTIQVVEMRRFTSIPYPLLIREVERLATEYPTAKVAIEVTGLGQAVMGSLNIPKTRLIDFSTTQTSKARALSEVAIALQRQELKIDFEEWPQLRQELLGYQVPDDYCQTDCVMALAVALDSAQHAYTAPARLIGVIHA